MLLFSWLSRFWISVSKLKIIFFFIDSGADYFLTYAPTSAFPQRHRITGFAAVVEGNAKDNAAQKGHSEGNGDMRLPQRHRFAGFAAVAERDAKDNAAQKGYSEGNGDMRLPQRHRITGFAAVVEGNAKDNAAQKGHSESNGDMRLPQRHRFAGFAAVAEGLSIFADEYGTERRDTREYDTA